MNNDIKEVEEALDVIKVRIVRVASILRSTAEELRTNRINPYHAANRIDNIADEIYQPKTKA